MGNNVLGWTIQPVRGLITLRIIYCFKKPPATVVDVHVGTKNRFKPYLYAAYHVTNDW